MPSQTVENYLKALYILSNLAPEVSLSKLSQHMGVSTPTANSMIKKLHSRGLVKHKKYKPIQLTKAGLKTAALIIRKHRLMEMYLVNKMNFGWEEVHEIAEQAEHIVSPSFFDRIDQILGYPTSDPHGSPIPDKSGKIRKTQYYPLAHTRQGDKVRLSALSHSSDDFLKYLNSKEIALGLVIKVRSIETFDNTYLVSYKNHDSETLSEKVCERLLVEKIED